MNRYERKGTDMKLIRLVLTMSLIVIVPWFFYANQLPQREICVMHELTGTKPGLAQQVTCALNGHAV
jgi:hypothetical protein